MTPPVVARIHPERALPRPIPTLDEIRTLSAKLEAAAKVYVDDVLEDLDTIQANLLAAAAMTHLTTRQQAVLRGLAERIGSDLASVRSLEGLA